MENLPSEFNVENFTQRDYTPRAYCDLVMGHYQDYKHSVHTRTETTFKSDNLMLITPKTTDRLVWLVREYNQHLAGNQLEDGIYDLICVFPFELIEPEIDGADRMTLRLDKVGKGFNITSTFQGNVFSPDSRVDSYISSDVGEEILQKVMPVLMEATPRYKPLGPSTRGRES